MLVEEKWEFNEKEKLCLMMINVALALGIVIIAMLSFY
jgi:hypothetical protein